MSHVACVPGGAHPSYAHGYSTRDNEFYRAWDAIAADRDRFQSWLDDNVFSERGSSVRANHRPSVGERRSAAEERARQAGGRR